MHDRVAGFLKSEEAVGTGASSVGSLHLVGSKDRGPKLLLQGQILYLSKLFSRPMKIFINICLNASEGM